MGVKISHRCIHARDVEATFHFYTTVLGMEVRTEPHTVGTMKTWEKQLTADPVEAEYWDGLVHRRMQQLFGLQAVREFQVTAGFMAAPGQIPTGPWIDTFEWVYPPYANTAAYDEVNHLGFARLEFLVDDFDGIQQRLRDYGSPFLCEEVTMPSVPSPRLTTKQRRSMTVRDPNGIVLILTEADGELER